jgi:hypothetical protein
MKPMPDTTPAATREGSRITRPGLRTSLKPYLPMMMKSAAPRPTSACVRRPADFWRHSRSSPISEESTNARPSSPTCRHPWSLTAANTKREPHKVDEQYRLGAGPPAHGGFHAPERSLMGNGVSSTRRHSRSGTRRDGSNQQLLRPHGVTAPGTYGCGCVASRPGVGNIHANGAVCEGERARCPLSPPVDLRARVHHNATRCRRPSKKTSSRPRSRTQWSRPGSGEGP